MNLRSFFPKICNLTPSSLYDAAEKSHLMQYQGKSIMGYVSKAHIYRTDHNYYHLD